MGRLPVFKDPKFVVIARNSAGFQPSKYACDILSCSSTVASLMRRDDPRLLDAIRQSKEAGHDPHLHVVEIPPGPWVVFEYDGSEVILSELLPSGACVIDEHGAHSRKFAGDVDGLVISARTIVGV